MDFAPALSKTCKQTSTLRDVAPGASEKEIVNHSQLQATIRKLQSALTMLRQFTSVPWL